MGKRLLTLVEETRELKNCLLAGHYERAYELAQNIDDELTTQALEEEKEKETTTSNNPTADETATDS